MRATDDAIGERHSLCAVLFQEIRDCCHDLNVVSDVVRIREPSLEHGSLGVFSRQNPDNHFRCPTVIRPVECDGPNGIAQETAVSSFGERPQRFVMHVASTYDLSG